MSAHPIEKLSDYIDGELSGPERAGVEAHLGICAECSRVAEELRLVVRAAREARDTAPAADLWPGIASRLGQRACEPDVVAIDSHRGRRRFSFSIPQLAAASIAVALLSAGAVWVAIREGRQPLGPTSVAERTISEEPITGANPAVGPNASAPAVTVAGGSAPQGFAEYESAVAELEQLLDEIAEDIDPETRHAIDENLAIIDQAIQQIRGAMEADPDDMYLNTHLASTMQRKIDVLQEATRLARTST